MTKLSHQEPREGVDAPESDGSVSGDVKRCPPVISTGSATYTKQKTHPAVCTGCGVEFLTIRAIAKNRKAKYCTKRCCADHMVATGRTRGERSPHWKGGVSRDSSKYSREHRERWPERYAARRAVVDALESGRMVKGPCERCGTDTRIEGHHDDYSKPLSVRWLCRAHHLEVHAELRAADSDPDKRKAKPKRTTTTRPTQED